MVAADAQGFVAGLASFVYVAHGRLLERTADSVQPPACGRQKSLRVSAAADFYDTLGVSRTADKAEIKKAYRQQARKFHPDVNKEAGAEDKFKAVSNAYEVLSDDQKRPIYDKYGEAGLKGMGGAGAGGPGVDFNNPFDIFEQFFGGGGGGFGGFGGGRAQQRQRAYAGEDQRYDLQLDFHEAVFGTTKDIDATRLEECKSCDNTGVQKGTQPRQCTTCGGTGQVVQTMRTPMGAFQQVTQCPTCDGQGEESTPCSTCGGDGRVRKPKRISLRVPPGVDTNSRLRVKDEGNAGRKGGPSGDLYVFISVREHPELKRDGTAIHSNIEISYVDAILGTSAKVLTVDGQVDLKIPAGTQPGTTLVMGKRGVPRLGSSAQNARGDHNVHVRVNIPTKPGKDESCAAAAEEAADDDLPTVQLLQTSSSSLQAPGTAAQRIVLNTGTERHMRNRQAQTRYRIRMRAQASLQAERAAFALEKQQWRDREKGQSQQLELQAPLPLEEFVVDPSRHSITVVRRAIAGPGLHALFQRFSCYHTASTELLGWHDARAILTDDLMTAMFAWTAAFRSAMRILVANYDAQPCSQNLHAMTQHYLQLKDMAGLFWEAMLEGHTWLQGIALACSAAAVTQWGEPLNDHWRRCIDSMRLTPMQKANCMKAYRKWQQQMAAAQHRSAHILPGMQVLQDRSTVKMKFLDHKTSEQLLRDCEATQKQAIMDLHVAMTAEINPYQFACAQVACHPYQTDEIKLLEAIEQSLADDCAQASLRQQAHAQAPPAHNHNADALLDDFGPSNLAGGAALPVRQDAGHLHDDHDHLDLDLEIGDPWELMEALI
ncbi:hypothetical protein WJX73_004512 [Symbiochloris irregularis]|uniref:Uncharacterized protein n=1 Tax=Symbiochloris irregularis TaxID=706552 RepID=A0AAW1P9A1_9CHLO